ncbi:MAG: winged helix-turn-helix domain-containing protein, partial [Burkholderiaceae bacterium]
MPVPDRLAFGDFVLERSQQRVTHRNGTQLNLTPRHFSALLLFAERAGQLLDKDTLMLALWPGLVVEENNLSQVVSSLRRALGDDTQGSRYIQTVPRRGFRFVAAVTALPDADELPHTDPLPHADLPASTPVPPDDPSKRHTLRLALAAGATAVVAGTAWWVLRGTPAAAPATKSPTLAVLPFKPLVAEGRDELLEVGMADSLIARLSTVPGLVVRSVGSVLRYAGPAQDPVLAARELDVTWIVDGS